MLTFLYISYEIDKSVVLRGALPSSLGNPAIDFCQVGS